MKDDAYNDSSMLLASPILSSSFQFLQISKTPISYSSLLIKP